MSKSEFEAKLKKAHAELDDSGMWAANYNSLIFRLLRKLGFQVRPAHYQSFLELALFHGIPFGTIWSTVMWFGNWRFRDIPISEALIWALITGTVFGFGMSVSTRFTAKRKGLSRWEDL